MIGDTGQKFNYRTTKKKEQIADAVKSKAGKWKHALRKTEARIPKNIVKIK